MISVVSGEPSGICAALSVKATRMRTSIAGVGALALLLLSGATAQAQCTVNGLTGLNAQAPVVAQAAGMAVANVSASVGTLITSINSVNTAFLTQSSAFVGSPPNPQPDQTGGGVWVRGVGGHLSSSTTATASNIDFGGAQPGSITCNTRTLEDFAGVQVGTDIAKLNVNGWNLHIGSTVGYLGAKTQDATAGLSPPANFHDSLQIPFMGLYGAASYGRLLVDGQIRGDFFQNGVSDNTNGLADQRFNARGISFTGNVAYNQPVGGNWFVEPSAGIVWSKTRVDPLNIPGTGIVGVPLGPGFVPPWVLTVNDIESVLGRVGVRVGTMITSGNMVWQPFASAGVFHEFKGDVSSNLMSSFSALGQPFAGLPALSSTVATNGIGTYGQFGLGISAQMMNAPWVSYLRADYRTGDNIEGWNVNGGLRFQFVPEAVVGVSLPTKAPVYKAPVMAAAYNWSGFYVGAFVGAARASADLTFLDSGSTTDPRFAGFLGGGEVGYDYQIGKWVIGVGGDFAWTNANGARPCPIGFFANCEIDTNWMSTATARVGYAYWDRLLGYVKGGAVIAQGGGQATCTPIAGVPMVPVAGCPTSSFSGTEVGWTAGVGSEFGITRNISLKSEIMYFDLGSDRYTLARIPTDVQRSGFMSTVGVRFRFNG
jgi:opacity protein-like surface antigen